MLLVAWPVLTGTKEKNSSISERTQAYTTSKNLLVNGADALERIMSSYKEVHVAEKSGVGQKECLQLKRGGWWCKGTVLRLRACFPIDQV